jgi:hypothetical protein
MKKLLVASAMLLALPSSASAFEPEPTVYTTQSDPGLQPFCVTRSSADQIAAAGVSAGFLFMQLRDCQLAEPGQRYKVQTRRPDLDPSLNVRRVHILGDDGRMAVAVWFITGVDKEE